MSRLSNSLAKRVPHARSMAIAALIGAAVAASPLVSARADSASNSTSMTTAPHSKAGAGAMQSKAETVEQRIASLHAALQITAQEETDWNGVAQAMRDNAAAMQKLGATDTATAPQTMTAVDDLKTYQKFAQAHVDGLKTLTSSFETLYNAMPDSQKKVADQVFLSSNHDSRSSHS
jgi:glutamine synthetase adenylyltransferase